MPALRDAIVSRRELYKMLQVFNDIGVFSHHLLANVRPTARARALGRRLNWKPCRRFPRNRRSWAHVGHRGPGVVCLRSGFQNLPDNVRWGILAHEIGHLLGGIKTPPRPDIGALEPLLATADRVYPTRTNAERVDEAVANWRAAHQLGIRIGYDRALRQTAMSVPWRRSVRI